ncbi:NnrU family protein [Burkholderiaceae bacterium UC74_6]
MIELIAGLVIFLGVHSVRLVAPDWRNAQIARRGETTWKLGYTAVSLLGFGLILWGFHLARPTPVVLWPRLVGMNHAASGLMVIAFILLAAAYVPRNHIRRAVGHPMVLSVKTWALAHLLANNTLADELLFGAFLLWAVIDYTALRRRDRGEGRTKPEASPAGTVATVVIGAAAAAAFAIWGHLWLIGVKPI